MEGRLHCLDDFEQSNTTAMLAAAVFVWHRKRRTQPPQSRASNAAPQQVEVVVTQPESKEAAEPESAAWLLSLRLVALSTTRRPSKLKGTPSTPCSAPWRGAKKL